MWSVDERQSCCPWRCGAGRHKYRASANASPTIKNYTPEVSAFEILAEVSPTEVQWLGLALGEPP